MTTDTTRTMERIIRDEIYVNASAMVQQLVDGGLCLNHASLGESHAECLAQPDYSEAPDDYVITATRKADGRLEFGWVNNADPAVEYDDGFDTEHDAIVAAWEDSGDEPPVEEALQHWLVSDWLADKLEDAGAMVSRDVLGFNVWGRAECGQPLEQDSDLRAVAAALACA